MGVKPSFEADTVTVTPGSVMKAASAGTLADQVAGVEVAVVAEITVSSASPTLTVTETPASVPVSPEIVNPAARSAMFTVSSPAMGPSRLSSRVPGKMVKVAVTLASFQLSSPTAVAVTTHSPSALPAPAHGARRARPCRPWRAWRSTRRVVRAPLG